VISWFKILPSHSRVPLHHDAAFYGWGGAQAFNARTLARHDRPAEARDAARVALAGSPWWGAVQVEFSLPSD
jgi:hypothetical protein